MLEKIKEKLTKTREKKKKKQNRKTTNYLIISILIGSVLGIVLYLFSKEISLFPLSVFFALSVSYIILPTLNDTKGKEREENQSYYDFYHSFIIYIALESSGQEAFKRATEELSISSLKDKLTAFVEGDLKGEPPLSYLNTLAENNLIDEIKRTLYEDEDYSIGFSKRGRRLLKAYENDLIVANTELTSLTPIIILLSIFLFSTLSAFTKSL